MIGLEGLKVREIDTLLYSVRLVNTKSVTCGVGPLGTDLFSFLELCPSLSSSFLYDGLAVARIREVTLADRVLYSMM